MGMQWGCNGDAFMLDQGRTESTLNGGLWIRTRFGVGVGVGVRVRVRVQVRGDYFLRPHTPCSIVWLAR